MSLQVRPWQSVRFSPPILVWPPCQAERPFWGAHSTDTRAARTRSSTTAVAQPRQPGAQLCASLPVQPAGKEGFETYDPMKARTRHGNSVKESTPTMPSRGINPTHEDIRRRAHELFLARGGEPGKELDDWLRAERQLKRKSAATRSETTH
jgi:hypothetical protein